MSRHQKILFPKIDSGVSGYQYPGSSIFNRRGDERPPHRVFRTKRKHVQRACERCRVKKAKCDGLQPCSRCVTYNQACIFRDRKVTQEKVYSRGFVEMLIAQHAVHLQALRDLYKRCVRREGFPGSPLQESIQGYPGTHAILDRLGLIKHAEEAVEDPQRVLADLVDFIKCLDSASDCGLDSVESTTDSTSEITVSEDLSPEPNTPRESPDSVVPSTTGTWATAASDEMQLCHAYGECKPMNPPYADMALGGTDDVCAMRTDEFAEVLWNYCPPQVRYIPAGIATSHQRTETLDISPSSASSSSWSGIQNQPSATSMPMTSRASVPEPMVYMTEQSGFPDGYAYAQAQTFATGPVQRHQHQHQRQRQFRRSVDYGLLNSGGQYSYL